MAKKATTTRKPTTSTPKAKPAKPAADDNTNRAPLKGPELDTSNGNDKIVDKQAKADEAARAKAAHTILPPIPQTPNPPEQPKMIPAKQVEGVTMAAVDPDDLPANRRNPHNVIRVQAKAIGYYDDVIRRVGDVFDIADERAFSDKWMRRVSPRTPERVTGSNAALERAKKGEPVNDEATAGAVGGTDVLGE